MVLVRPEAEADHGTIGQMQPMGSADEVFGKLALFNTAGDGSVGSMGTVNLYGPGFVAQIASGVEQVNQILVSVTEQDTAWPVLSRLCRAFEWRLMDAETGQVFG